MASARSSRGALLVLCCLAAAGCGPAPRAPEVEYAGCVTVLRGPICAPDQDRRLRLWVRSPAGVPPVIEAGGRRLTSSGIAVGDGLRFELGIPEAATEIVVRGGGEAKWVWTLALTELESPAWFQLAARQSKNKELNLEAFRRLLEEKAASPPSFEQTFALGKLARLQRQSREYDKARETLKRAIRAHRDAGREKAEVDDQTVLVSLLLEERLFAEARTILDSIRLRRDAPAEAACWVAYYRGLLATNVGDFRTALGFLNAAAEQAERVGMRKELRAARQVSARLLRMLGRSREADDLFVGLEKEARAEAVACDLAKILTNYGWNLLLALEAGEAVDRDPVPMFEEVLAILTTTTNECRLNAGWQVNVLLNLALAHLHGGRPDLARQSLTEARARDVTPKVTEGLWWLELDGRIALADGRPDQALKWYSDLAEMAVSSAAARWRAAMGRARSLAALGRRPAALDALAEAEALLDEESLQVALHDGRGSFIAQREGGTRFYLDLLLAAGRDAEAFAVTRRARSRVLRGLRRTDRLSRLGEDAQQRWDRDVAAYRSLREQLDADAAGDWQLPADHLRRVHEERKAEYEQLQRVLDRAFAVVEAPSTALPPPRTGEVVLAYHPLPQGWVGFAAAAGGVTVRRFGAVDAEPDARLPEPFADEITRARRVRVLPYGPLRAVDFHALPFAGGVLLAARPVVYGLDLSPPPRPSRARPFRALVVADPAGNLPAARAEAEAVRRALEAKPGSWIVRVLVGSEARGVDVRGAIPDQDLFHYAGHAVFAGRGGWESALPLADGGRLTVGDILALERAPRWVVLSGCETARSGGEAPLESIGLAHAFVAAGTGQVLAAVRPLPDTAAATLIKTLYRDWDGSADLAAVVRGAQLEWRRQDPAADWASFRVIEP
ncbi:MAG: CHAT domain-containing protein [bacterium]|nr:CHAT domain-containing protein [bacterium]